MQIKSGHLYLADLNPPRGTEPGKLRPVIVLQTDQLNLVDHLSTIIIPCTTNLKEQSLLRVTIPPKSAGNLRECQAMVDQIRSIDNIRIKKELGLVPELIFKNLKNKVKLILDL